MGGFGRFDKSGESRVEFERKGRMWLVVKEYFR